jgi:hypothetical protein
MSEDRCQGGGAVRARGGGNWFVDLLRSLFDAGVLTSGIGHLISGSWTREEGFGSRRGAGRP